MFRQRQLDQDSVDRVIFVEPANFREQLFGRDGAWNRELAAVDSKLLACLGLHVDVCRRSCIVSHQHNGKAWLDPALLEHCNLGSNLTLNVFGDFCPVDECSSHNKTIELTLLTRDLASVSQ